MPELAGLLCGVDIGTTHIKAALVAGDGSVVSVSKVPTPVISDGYGPCHDPEQIRLAAEHVMCQAQREAPAPGRITAVGVTSVGEEGVPLDPRGRVLYPSIAWYDRRPSSAERDWSARHGDEELFAVTGLHKDLGFTIFKWLWLKAAQPSAWSRCTAWLGIADYVVWRWTGQYGMSIGHASRTAVFDLRSFRWKEDWAAEALPRGADALPLLHEAGSPVGFLRHGIIPGLVTEEEVPVVATGLDHVVGAYAAGVQRPGQVLDSLGTAEALIGPVPPEHLHRADYRLGVDFGAGILPRTHIAIASLESGAGVSGMLEVLGATGAAERQKLESEAARLLPGAAGLTYVPPRMRTRSGGAFLGHKVTHRAADVYRAVVEGWALAADGALSGLGDPGTPQQVTCIGGGSGSPLWMRIKASILDREIRCLRTPEIVAAGAALLAARAVPGSGAMANWKPAASAVAPVPDWVPRYRVLRQEFRRLAHIVHPAAGPCVYP